MPVVQQPSVPISEIFSSFITASICWRQHLSRQTCQRFDGKNVSVFRPVNLSQEAFFVCPEQCWARPTRVWTGARSRRPSLTDQWCVGAHYWDLLYCRITQDCAGPPWQWWPRFVTKPPPCLLPPWLTRPWVKDFTLGKNRGAPTVQRRQGVEVEHLSQWRHHQQQQPSHHPLIKPPHPVLATVRSPNRALSVSVKINLFGAKLWGGQTNANHCMPTFNQTQSVPSWLWRKHFSLLAPRLKPHNQRVLEWDRYLLNTIVRYQQQLALPYLLSHG